ncbi:hypothetical protein [Paucilactobacillus nenjiangensis]|jgi:hypothetical protein|uniref:hypothetical protein n=2 Tax=Paucilactobacillus nenjiangensis TaxID=1296540 RepID=UPI003BAE2B24
MIETNQLPPLQAKRTTAELRAMNKCKLSTILSNQFINAVGKCSEPGKIILIDVYIKGINKADTAKKIGFGKTRYSEYVRIAISELNEHVKELSGLEFLLY